MKSKAFKLLLLLIMCVGQLLAQYTLEGTVHDAADDQPIKGAEVYIQAIDFLSVTDANGFFQMTDIPAGKYQVIIFSYQYQTRRKEVYIEANKTIDIHLNVLTNELSEVLISQSREETFGLSRLRPVEGTAIFAGKKTEVVLIDQTVANLAANNARQIYSHVVGLNIYESADAGLQLSVGGRGLDPNRTANFNTRQNDYDISADVLGYPESYYTPPAEALEEIEVVRGAASLQYGTQFGGLINFRMKAPNPVKKMELVSRQTVGSYNLFTSFNSLSGTIGKFSYYTYFNYKSGHGFRANSGFDSKNYYSNLRYAVSDRTILSLETTFLKYLAQQAGGLTDTQFRINPDFSNRTRNWFEVDWKLMAVKLKHKFSRKTDWSVNLFTLDASRRAVGFRGNPARLNSNPITEPDESDIAGNFVHSRDLIKGNFKNWGMETRLLTRYNLGKKDAVFLIGSKYYHANNTAEQGPGTNLSDPDFSLAEDVYPDYPNRSSFKFPNRNVAVFGENIVWLNHKFSVTPGFRLEYIGTESVGNYQQVNFDLAGNPIFNVQNEDNRMLERSFALLGVGLSYEYSHNLELYGNFSENYRSVTFSDIRTVNPTFLIDPEIGDEDGFTFDMGFRGKWHKYISYDVNIFGLYYNNRIGTILVSEGPFKGDRLRANIGSAFIYGFESFAEWNILNSFSYKGDQFKLNWFVNSALTNSEYISSKESNVQGKKVEFIPLLNLKTGVKSGYRNFLISAQFTYLTKQFTDGENSLIAEDGDSRNGIIGEIPAYSILDISLSYKYKKWKMESGLNNALNRSYFTRRATGYPGPGIIPSEPRTFYVTLGVKW